MGYTIREIKSAVELSEYSHFCLNAAFELKKQYDSKFNPIDFTFSKGHRLTICFKDGSPVGFMLARLSVSIFDPNVKILLQDLLYAKSGSRAAKLLLDDFIDFGKRNANHIITMIAENTNIKERSFERLGFKKIETLYRLEV